jgi:hypothetical protein
MANQDLLGENIIALLGLESLPDTEKLQMLEKMSLLVQKRVLLRVMDVLQDEDADKMAVLEQNPQEMMAFIAERVPNFQEIVDEEVLKLKAEMLAAAEQAV